MKRITAIIKGIGSAIVGLGVVIVFVAIGLASCQLSVVDPQTHLECNTNVLATVVQMHYCDHFPEHFHPPQ